MLRVEIRDAANTLTIRLEGRFVGTFAEEARTLVAHSKFPGKLRIDLSEVSFVDAVGEEVLSWLAGIGATFVAESSYPRDVCGRLHLPFARKRNGFRSIGLAQPGPSGNGNNGNK